MLSTITGERGWKYAVNNYRRTGVEICCQQLQENGGGDIHVSAVMNIIIYLQEYTHLITTTSYIVLKLKMNIIVHDVYVC